MAGDEAERLGNRQIGTEPLLLGILRLKDSLAATLLIARGAKADAIREQIAKPSVLASTQPAREALIVLDDFLGGLQGEGSQQLAAFFHDRGQFIDSSGKRLICRK